MSISRRTALMMAFASSVTGGAFLGNANTARAQATGKSITKASGFQITDSKVGTGATPKSGQTCVMHYTGWLYQDGVKGKKFDSSVDRGEPFEFPLGQRRVIGGAGEGGAHKHGWG